MWNTAGKKCDKGKTRVGCYFMGRCGLVLVVNVEDYFMIEVLIYQSKICQDGHLRETKKLVCLLECVETIL